MRSADRRALAEHLFTAASQHIYLLGWTASGDGRQTLAQRYPVQSLRLVEASGNATFGAHVLAAMSDQASMLGHPHEALQLATADRHGLARAPTAPPVPRNLWALQSRAHAALGESRDDEGEWARFIDTAYLAGQWATAIGDIAQPVESTRFARRSATEARNQKRPAAVR